MQLAVIEVNEKDLHVIIQTKRLLERLAKLRDVLNCILFSLFFMNQR